MKLFVGIDGGQSSTSAVIGDEAGTILGRGTSGPADEVAQDSSSTRLRDSLENAVSAALEAATLPHDAHFETIVAGVSGYTGTLRGKPPRFHAKKIELMHDTVIAHAGALETTPGILVIAGTGSVAYGIGSNKKNAIVGGWGHLFGDEGSGFWIATCAIRQALYLEDAQNTRAEAIGADRELIRMICEFFDTTSVREMTRRYYRKEITRDAVAALTKVLIERAAGGETRSRKIVRNAVQELVQLATACARAIENEASQIAFVGGLVKNEWFSHQLDVGLEKTKLQRVVPKHDPAIGALLLARQYAR